MYNHYIKYIINIMKLPIKLNRQEYDKKLIDTFKKISSKFDINPKIKILMRNETTDDVITNIQKLFSNMAQNMQKYTFDRSFYYTIKLDSIQKLIKFFKQDLETDDWLVETSTPKQGDTPFQNYNFWKTIIIYFDNYTLTIEPDYIEFNHSKNTSKNFKKINKIICDSFTNKH
ncbi:putative secretion chaperone-like protein [Cotonvirus japonicus]|uniref:Secretion chaperone-like protein n=1 Tax=Cotonvirus japonicus TaxID=2811091 RepID=A0ABM7NQY1_9VIRU|nr:putative secretion chaperone-like protein [Cotonvirus japonicus]BCS82561.1 putative secretion chaperone-like protein [Cotonvirus japonicus]